MKNISLLATVIAVITVFVLLNLKFTTNRLASTETAVPPTKNIEYDDYSITSICPHNIYSATMMFENDTMKIVGPKGCTVPFYRNSLEALTSNYREAKWIVSSGASTFFGVSLNLLRMFIDKSDYSYDDLIAQQLPENPSDIIELVIDRKGKSLIRVWKEFSDYQCFSSVEVDDQNEMKDNILMRLTVLHSQWMVRFFWLYCLLLLIY